MTQNHAGTRFILGDRGQTVDRSANDVHRRQIKNNTGDGIGPVDPGDPGDPGDPA